MQITKKVFNEQKVGENQEAKKKRACCYARVSTDSDDQEFSYESQVAYYTTFIKANPDLEFAGCYHDLGITGTTDKRPDFQRMMQDCEDGKIDFIYCKSISRFARNAADCMTYLDKLQNKKVVVYFEKENIYSDDKNLGIVLKLLATIAQEEVNSISQASRQAYIMNAKNCKPTRCCPYGYYKIQEGKNKHKWVIDKDEALRINKIFSLAYAGLPNTQIAEILNKDEAKVGSDIVWRPTRIASVLSNEVYKGDILTHKRIKPDYMSNKTIVNNGSQEQVYIEGHHEPIVSVAMFNEVQRIIESRRMNGNA